LGLVGGFSNVAEDGAQVFVKAAREFAGSVGLCETETLKVGSGGRLCVINEKEQRNPAILLFAFEVLDQ